LAQGWKVEHGSGFATLYSKLRMPHSSRRGPMDEARRALRSAIENITARPGYILEGTYSSTIDGFFDVENVVVYNIETATFRNAARHGLSARRSRSFDKSTLEEGSAHRLHYQLVPRPTAPSDPIVHLQFAPTNFRNVFAVWWAAANGTVLKSGTVSGRYGLHIELSGDPLPSNPAGKLKILFDGVIAALQREQALDPKVVHRLSLKHGIDGDILQQRFSEPVAAAIQSSRRAQLVRPFGAGVQWHPADDLCEECTLIVREKPMALCHAYVYPL
jgi:hypothetical protein